MASVPISISDILPGDDEPSRPRQQQQQQQKQKKNQKKVKEDPKVRDARIAEQIKARQEAQEVIDKRNKLEEEERLRLEKEAKEKAKKAENLKTPEIFDTTFSYDAKTFLRYLIIDALPPMKTFANAMVKTGFVELMKPFLETQLKDRKNLKKGDLRDLIVGTLLKNPKIIATGERDDLADFRKAFGQKETKNTSYKYRYFEQLGFFYRDIPMESKWNHIPFILRLIDILDTLFNMLYSLENESMKSVHSFFTFYLFFIGTPTESLIDKYVETSRNYAGSSKSEYIEALRDIQSRIPREDTLKQTFLQFLNSRIQQLESFSDSKFNELRRLTSIFDTFQKLRDTIKKGLSDLEN
jgi:hypothetical protein